MDVSETLQRKIGPLPVWAWGGVAGGTLLVVKALSGGGGASSPFVTPIATDIPFDYDSLSGAGSGGGGGGGSAAPPTPNPSPSPAPRPRPTKAEILRWRPRRSIAPVPASSPAPSTDVRRRRWLAAGPAGDTAYGSEGDTTPGTPLAAVPWSVPPVPLGSTLPLPVLDAPDRYAGVTVDALAPIASSARVIMPTINAEPTGSVVVPKIPDPSARAGTLDPRRLLDPVAGAFARRVPITGHTRDLAGYNPSMIVRDLRARFRDRSG